jgi:hypothetical protein
MGESTGTDAGTGIRRGRRIGSKEVDRRIGLDGRVC